MTNNKKDKERRLIFVSIRKPTHKRRDLIPERGIYVYLHQSEKRRIIADAISYGVFESVNNLEFTQVYEDSNFVGEREVIPYDSFIDVLAKLNDGEVLDYTLKEGVMFGEIIDNLKERISSMQNACRTLEKILK